MRVEEKAVVDDLTAFCRTEVNDNLWKCRRWLRSCCCLLLLLPLGTTEINEIEGCRYARKDNVLLLLLLLLLLTINV